MVNAATGFAVFDLDLGSGVVRVVRMERLLERCPHPSAQTYSRKENPFLNLPPPHS